MTLSDIENIILDGENEQVEFKQQDSEKYGKIGFDIAIITKQLISMVNNKHPGIAILGVDDESEINGVKGLKLGELIDSFQSHIDQIYEPQFSIIGKEFYPIEEKPKVRIIILTVLSEHNKLYSQKKQGDSLYFPIRRGATTRGMQSSEIEEFYSNIENDENLYKFR